MWVGDPRFKQLHARGIERLTLEWFGGQILDVIESESLFAINSLINCVDQFAPR